MKLLSKTLRNHGTTTYEHLLSLLDGRDMVRAGRIIVCDSVLDGVARVALTTSPREFAVHASPLGVQLHSLDGSEVVLSTLNGLLPPSTRIMQRRGEWYVTTDGKERPFTDGLCLPDV